MRMDQQRYLIHNKVLLASDPKLQEALASVHETPTRPKCLCVKNGVEMYVSKFRQFVVKRMPETGSKHHVSCPSYEPPVSESGLGYVIGEAVIEKAPDLIEVRLDFPLTRYDVRAAERGEPCESGSVSGSRKRLGIRGLLHLLWDRAQFNRWHPRMENKRSWWVVRKHLIEAAAETEVQGKKLSERLFIPEPFKADAAEQIAKRRQEALAVISPLAGDSKHRLMLAIGELKEFQEVRFGHKLVLKHLPDCPFWLNTDLAGKIRRHFESAFQALQTQVPVHLIVGCTIRATEQNNYQVDTATIMMTTINWIPIDNLFEKTVADALTREGRRFRKQLRYDSPATAAFPNFLLLDMGDRPLALDIVVPTADRREREAKEKAILSRPPGSLVWRTDASLSLPQFPKPGATETSPARQTSASARETV
jgi:Protein of unknown function (DUF1173)